MRLSRSLILLPGIALGAGLVAGCSGDTTTHAGHDHGAAEDGHAGHAHGGQVAGRAAMKKIAPSANYPLTTCVVSGDKLDAMGERLAFEYEGREVQFCCDGCIDEFLEDPAEFTGKLPTAAK